LLQPLRDLSKVWNVEVAEELEKYIGELTSVSFQAEDGSQRLNFAEAALLIQGSTAIYSRKVEQLYNLVYQALATCQLHSEKEKCADGHHRKKHHAGPLAAAFESEELLTIDHLIKEGRNITLDQSALRKQEQRLSLHAYRRLPLFLMPRELTEGKPEFSISSCTIHRSGAYFIQQADARLLDEEPKKVSPDACDEHFPPLAPPPPQEVRDLDERLQQLLKELPGGPAVPDSPPIAEEAPTHLEVPNVEIIDHVVDDEGMALSDLLTKPVVPEKSNRNCDPWALLDEDVQVGQDVPLDIGACTKRFGNKRLLAKGAGVSDLCNSEGLSDADLWRPGRAAGALPSLTEQSHPNSIFLMVARLLRSSDRCEVQKFGFSSAWLEFEDLFQDAMSKRRRDKRSLKSCYGSAPNTPMQADFCGGNSDIEQDILTPPRCAEDFQDTPLRNDVEDFSEEARRLQEQRIEVAKLEGLIDEAQSQYEASIRSQLHHIQGVGDPTSDKYPEIYENVRIWQEQLKPVLKEFESRPEFNIESYKNKMMDKMASVEKYQEKHQQGSSIPFARLVHGQPHWEVCRRFLTCLILTSEASAEILCHGEDSPHCDFSLKVQSSTRVDSKDFAIGSELDADVEADPLLRPGKRLKTDVSS